MKKGRTRLNLTREEVAQELSRLAGQVADGTLRSAGVEIALPDKLRFDLEVKEKDSKVVLHLSLKGTSGKDGTTDRRIEITRPGKRPYRAKKIKKAMAGQWKEIRRSIRERSVHADTGGLASLLKEYGKLAEPGWQEAWDDCEQRLLSLLNHLERSEFDQAEKAAAEVEDLMKSCHKRYK